MPGAGSHFVGSWPQSVPPPSDLSSSALYEAHRKALVDYANRIVRHHARAEDVVQDRGFSRSAIAICKTIT